MSNHSLILISIEKVRAAALNFATCIAHESHALRPAKHDFSEVVKAVVQLMAKDGRFEGLLMSVVLSLLRLLYPPQCQRFCCLS